MASFTVTGRLNKNSPRLRFVPDNGAASPLTGTNLIDWFDETFRRYKSGVVSVQINGITAGDQDVGPTGALYHKATHPSPVYTTTETVAISAQPPLYNALNDGQYLNSGASVPGSAGNLLSDGAPTYKNIVAVNYGQPGPSAWLAPDGTITFTAIDLELSSNAFTDITSDVTVTLSGALTATIGASGANYAYWPYTPYATNSIGTGYTLNLVSGPLTSSPFLAAAAFSGGPYQGAWGIIGCPVQAALAVNANAGYIASLQLTSVTTIYIPGAGGPPSRPPMLVIKNPAQPGGYQLCDVNLPICLEAQKTLTFKDNYTFLYAINSPVSGGVAIDANATQIGLVDLASGSSPAYNLANAGIVQSPDDTGTVACSLKYAIAVTTVGMA